jgi:hypothetical protein
MGRLRVQHCLVNQTTRQYGQNPTSDLLGVDYFHTVPPDTEFPRTVGKLELFVRFFGTDGIGVGSASPLLTSVRTERTEKSFTAGGSIFPARTCAGRLFWIRGSSFSTS